MKLFTHYILSLVVLAASIFSTLSIVTEIEISEEIVYSETEFETEVEIDEAVLVSKKETKHNGSDDIITSIHSKECLTTFGNKPISKNPLYELYEAYLI